MAPLPTSLNLLSNHAPSSLMGIQSVTTPELHKDPGSFGVTISKGPVIFLGAFSAPLFLEKEAEGFIPPLT